MARFYFNVRHGPGPEGLARDLEGDELPDDVAARAHALAVARDLIARTQVHGVRNWFDCAFEITDETGRPIMTVPFGDTVAEEPDEG